MERLESAYIFSALLCACAALNPIDLGHMYIHAKVGEITNVSYPPSADDNTASANARTTLERFRDFFPVGIGPIPTLDPYKTNNFIVNVNRSDFEASIVANNVVLSGAQKFKVSGLMIYLETHRVDINLLFPVLNLHFDCNLHYKSDEFDQHINSTFSLKLEKVETKVSFSTEVVADFGSDEQFINIIGVEMHAYADNIEYDLENLPRSRRSVPVSHLTATVAHDVKEDVGQAIAMSLREELQILIKNYTYKQIMAILLPK